MDFQREYDICRQQIDERLNSFFDQDCPQKELLDAMRYSLLAGGKRIRPVLTMKFCQAAGGAMEDALDFACGVEMLHTYSLVHDDLPCMDDDDLRRGKPTCHKIFGETVAVLAGDALQAAAFRTVLGASGFKGKDGHAMAAYFLADAASEIGMCGGQYLDTAKSEANRTEEDLRLIHAGKTGALLRAACLMGICAATKNRFVPKAAFNAAKEYAENLGMAFQIQDDILDITATTEMLGKPVGSDVANDKTTFVSLFGVDGCQKLVFEYTQKAKQALVGIFDQPEFLFWMADLLATREH